MSDATTPDPDDKPPIPGYRLYEVLGRGGMATVYRAKQTTLNRDVAVKVMAPALSADPSFRERFYREGRILAALSHPNIVEVFDIGEYGGRCYFAMALLTGGTLRARIRAGLSQAETLAIADAIAAALGHAHREGVIHRDVKPQNVLFRSDGTPVLTDFGIAKSLNASAQMTAAGYTLGSASYMSPEQALGRPLDGRADLYSLGVVLWEMLVGRVPYHGTDALAIATKHTVEPLPPLPPQLDAYRPLLETLLAKKADDRFDDADALRTALLPLRRVANAEAETLVGPLSVDPLPIPQQVKTARRGPLHATLAVAALAAVVAAGLWWWTQSAPGDGPGLRPPLATPASPGGAGDPVLPPAAEASPAQRLAALLRDAEAQWQADKRWQPEGDSAFDSYSAALQIEPMHALARRRLVEIGRARWLERQRRDALALFDRGELDASLAKIHAGLTLAPDDEELGALRAAVRAQRAGAE